MIDTIIKGGPVMIPILLGSLIGWTIVIDRLWVFRKMRMNTFAFVHEVFKELKSGNEKGALRLCDKYISHPLAAVYRVGIIRSELAPERLEKILEQAGNNQILKMERYLGALVAVVSIEPLLGFLGTITGLIRSFMSWEKAGADVTVSVLAAGMYQAMITTAAGLIVAIPLYLCYSYFVSRIKYVANDMTNHCVQLIEVINDKQGGAKK
jgi:biopolymer transport protein ExbB